MEGGRDRVFCLAMQSRRRRKKPGPGRCAEAIETQSSSGHTGLIEACVGASRTAKRKGTWAWLRAHRRLSLADQRQQHHRPLPRLVPDASPRRPRRRLLRWPVRFSACDDREYRNRSNSRGCPPVIRLVPPPAPHHRPSGSAAERDGGCPAPVRNRRYGAEASSLQEAPPGRGLCRDAPGAQREKGMGQAFAWRRRAKGAFSGEFRMRRRSGRWPACRSRFRRPHSVHAPVRTIADGRTGRSETSRPRFRQ